MSFSCLTLFLNALFEEVLELVEVFVTDFFGQFFVYIRNGAPSDFFLSETLNTASFPANSLFL